MFNGMEVKKLRQELETALFNLNKAKEQVKDQQEYYEKVVADKNWELKTMKFQMDNMESNYKIRLGEEMLQFKKESLEKLTISDINKEVAEAKLYIYEKMDTKAERKQIADMLDKAIIGLSNKATVQVVK